MFFFVENMVVRATVCANKNQLMRSGHSRITRGGAEIIKYS